MFHSPTPTIKWSPLPPRGFSFLTPIQRTKYPRFQVFRYSQTTGRWDRRRYLNRILFVHYVPLTLLCNENKDPIKYSVVPFRVPPQERPVRRKLISFGFRWIPSPLILFSFSTGKMSLRSSFYLLLSVYLTVQVSSLSRSEFSVRNLLVTSDSKTRKIPYE